MSEKNNIKNMWNTSYNQSYVNIPEYIYEEVKESILKQKSHYYSQSIWDVMGQPMEQKRKNKLKKYLKKYLNR
jgi:hypothetical protein